MRAVMFTLMCMVVSGTALPATVYKWVDADGVTHYSDQPHPGAQKVDRLMKMTPEQREKALQNVPPARRENIERRL